MPDADRAESRRLLGYAAVMGSGSVAVGGLVSLAFPSPWNTLMWIVIALALIVVAGLAYRPLEDDDA